MKKYVIKNKDGSEQCGGIIYLKPHGTACFWTYRSTGI